MPRSAGIGTASAVLAAMLACAPPAGRRPDALRARSMRVEFERSGGFGGLRRVCTVDEGTLPPDEVRQLRDLVQAAGFFDLPAEVTARRPGGDRFHYRVTVDDSERRHTVVLDEVAVPDGVRPLVDWLSRRATPAPLAGEPPRSP
jgi:hypothetical protein